MNRFSLERLHWAFVTLMVLAVGGAVFAALSGSLLVPVVIVLAAAVAKARLVILDFMDLREARGLLRTALIGWPVFFLVLALSRAVLITLV
ncbi:cytochrome C oxidase subunit IV family protein [Rhizobium terricola]|jgi:nitric oxide reductase NorF protein|uniref:Cytochrome C oxidase subunit IV n=1 Tax=Rhizobium terricola TaxID=2728849 RepID=A0A7Y0FXV6_9HYPH|nr:cytochrome C oxidase subunit IV family protein [Rhizobium terricola]NML76064.1 hypothetical protein [Rhizobium terricola]